MPVEEKKGWCVRKLARGEHQRARKLYEEAFPEDDRAFVDYYFRVKAAENEIYVVEEAETGEILATLHLNPYPLRFFEQEVPSAYIVAVATRADCRHQGMMRSLLSSSLNALYRRGDPLTWLMPAAKEIYLPFDFRYLYRKNRMQRTADGEGAAPLLSVREAGTGDAPALAAFAGEILPRRAQVYALHTEAYVRERMQELASEGGRLVLLEKEKSICGYFMGNRARKEAWEIVTEAEEKEAEAAILSWFGAGSVTLTAFPKSWEGCGSCSFPAIMGRIVHLAHFVSALQSPVRRQWRVRLHDGLIPQNNGAFAITVDGQGGTLTPAADTADLRDMEIGQLLEEMWTAPVFLNEVV